MKEIKTSIKKKGRGEKYSVRTDRNSSFSCSKIAFHKKIFSFNFIMLVVFMMGLFLLSSCSSYTARENVDESTGLPKKTEFGTGSEGVVAGIDSESLPEYIYEGEALEVQIMLENQGAFDVEKGKLYITGFDEEYFTVYGERTQSFSLKGKSNFYPRGEYALKNFRVRNKRIPYNMDRMKSSIIVNVCYPYKTISSTSVCIEGNSKARISREVVDQVCTPKKEITFSGGQGGPVGIVKILRSRESSSSRMEKMTFDIYFKNLGEGIIKSPSGISYEDYCKFSEDDETSVLPLVSAYLGGEQLECNNEEAMSFAPKNMVSDYVRCEGMIDKQSIAYETPLTVHLDYGYIDSAYAVIEVKDI